MNSIYFQVNIFAVRTVCMYTRIVSVMAGQIVMKVMLTKRIVSNIKGFIFAPA